MNRARRVCALALFALVCAPSLFAARFVGFQTDAFNRAYPISHSKNAVFSPASFEIDCALVAESLATIPKAHVAERMGVLLDYESTFKPILEAFNERTNGLTVISARGFCVPEIKLAPNAHRQYLESVYGAEVLRLFPPKGAESWFRASMEGEMEEFEISVESSRANRYSFYDAISVQAEFLEPFPTEVADFAFRPNPDSPETVSVSGWTDVRVAKRWETEEYTLLSLPLKGEASLYLMLPKAGYDLAPAKQDISSTEIDHLLHVVDSVTEKGVAAERCLITLPRLDLFSRTEFSSVLTYYKIPLSGLVLVAGDLTAREYVQYARFRLLNPRGGTKGQLASEPSIPKFVFDHPFLFFVYHEPTATIPIAGQFFGR